MAQLLGDEGIVLRRRTFADADRVLVIFTRGGGKLSCIAKGARRPKARNSAGLDLLTRSELLLVPGRNLSVVAQARPLGLPWPASDVLRTACGAVLAELVDATLEEGQPEPELYRLTAEARERMADIRDDARVELAIAAFQIADHGGYRPELDRCAVCREPLQDRDGGFLPALGGVVQGSCGEGRADLLACSAPSLRALRRLAAGDLQVLRRLRWTGAMREEVEEILLSHLQHHLERPLRSAQVLAQLRPDPAAG